MTTPGISSGIAADDAMTLRMMLKMMMMLMMMKLIIIITQQIIITTTIQLLTCLKHYINMEIKML